MVNTYQLVNPYIKGKMKTSIKAKNSIEAATQLYSSMSEHFSNALPKFLFTIQKGGSLESKMYHFQVTEKRNSDNNEVTFKLEEFKGPPEQLIDQFKSKLKNHIQKIEQDGGAKKKKHSKRSKSSKHRKKSKNSSDSESDSESDFTSSDDMYIKTRKYYYTQPIYSWWYDPFAYGVEDIYLQTFYSWATPPVIMIGAHSTPTPTPTTVSARIT